MKNVGGPMMAPDISKTWETWFPDAPESVHLYFHKGARCSIQHFFFQSGYTWDKNDYVSASHNT